MCTYLFRQDPSDNQILQILRQRTTDVEVKKYCVSLLRKAGSFEYTRSVLKELDERTRQEVEKIPGGNPGLIRLLDELRNWE